MIDTIKKTKRIKRKMSELNKNPIYEKIQESLGDILSKYVCQLINPQMEIDIINDLNNHLNNMYNSDEIYVKRVWEDSSGAIQIEFNPNGIIKTRDQKIDEILNDSIEPKI